MARIFTNKNLEVKNKGFFLRKIKENERRFGSRPEKDALPLLRDVNHTPEKCVRLLKERFLMLEDYLLLPDDPLLMINDCVRLLRDGFIMEDDNRLVVNDWVLLMKERVVVLKTSPPAPLQSPPGRAVRTGERGEVHNGKTANEYIKRIFIFTVIARSY